MFGCFGDFLVMRYLRSLGVKEVLLVDLINSIKNE